MAKDDMPEEVAAAVTFHAEKEKFLVMRRVESMDVNPGKWDFASGRIEPGEDPGDTALRELMEEASLKGEILKSGEGFVQQTSYGVFRVHPFLVLVRESSVRMNSEQDEYRWINLCDLEELDTVEGLEKDLERLGIDK